MPQLSLFHQPKPIDPESRFGRWLAFHRANPGVWRLFKRFAMEALNSGRNHFGGRLIGERIRWYTRIETTGEDYKVNDHYWPYYTRLLMLTDNRFEHIFERRDKNFDTDDETLLREGLR